MSHIEFISAGAGSGKTFALTEKLEGLLSSGEVQPSGVMATTFTRLAASELQERVRQKLIQSGQVTTANAMGQALIGTVNGVCGELLNRFSFEAGLPPEQKVLEESEGGRLFGQAMESVLEGDLDLIRQMNQLAIRLGYVDAQSKRLTWRTEVRRIVDAARANNTDVSQLDHFATQSADSLLTHFPKATTRKLSEQLLAALNHAIAGFDPEVDTTKGSHSYFEMLEGVRVGLGHDRLTWPEWIKLSKSGPAKKSAEIAEPVKEIARNYDKHPQLHQDLRQFIGHCFSIAGRSMTAFQQLKARLGVIDFVDQEQCLLELLDNPAVADTLRSELQLLMVDEFQDTSPIQLAVFVKLSELADRVIWVGDIKQSIYGFRGSDPELMLSVLDYLKGTGVTPQILSSSWRSLPGLVDYSNALFVPAFAESLTALQVSLTPQRKDPIGGSVVEHWTLQGANKGIQAAALAVQIKAMVTAQDRKIVDRHLGTERVLAYSDMAVLCRSHSNLAGVAAALAKLDVPVSYKRAGLLKTPEAGLALACLRRLADARDTLATAEIRALTSGQSAEDWLGDRLRYLKSDKPGSEWSEEAISALGELALQRQRLKFMMPPETFQQAIVVANVRDEVVRWCRGAFDVQQRLANIDALLSLAELYIDQCDSQSLAATVPGLILWLDHQAQEEEDWQAQPACAAVTLVTHHGAKGLEWPVVIAMDLTNDTRSRLWGLSVESRAAGFQWHNPLADRSLRYWPSFFGMQSSGIPVKDDLEASDAGQAAHSKAVEEDKRLLYVSLTRARDLLILPTTQKKQSGPWMDSLGADWMLPNGDKLQLPGGNEIVTAAVDCPEIVPTASISANKSPTLYWPDLTRTTCERVKRHISPSSVAAHPDASIASSKSIGERLEIQGTPEMATLGSALHAIIATEVIARDRSLSRAERVLHDYGMSKTVDAGKVVAQVDAFIADVESRFKPTAWHVEYPIHFTNEQGQTAKGWIDLALETEQGWVVIDHKSSPHPRNEWAEIALSYSGQLDVYRQALSRLSDVPVRSCWIHYVVTAGMVEVQ